MFGFCAGLLVNYILSIIFVYQNTKTNMKTTDKKVFIVFTVLSLIGLLITELGMLLANHLIAVYFDTSSIKVLYEMGAKVIMTAIVLVYNYISRKVIIFK